MITRFRFSAGQHLLLRFLVSRWRAGCLIFCLDLFISVCTIGISLALAQAVALLLGFQSQRGMLLGLYLPGSDSWLWLLFGIVMVKLLADGLRIRQAGRLTEDFAFFLRNRVFSNHLEADASTEPGKKLLRLSSDLGSAQQLLSRGVLRRAADWVLIAAGLTCIFLLHAGLALAVFVSFLISLAVVGSIHRHQMQVEKKRRNKKAALLSFSNSVLAGLSGIQALNRVTRTEQQFRRKAESIRRLGYSYSGRAALSEALSAFVAQGLLLLALALGAWMLVSPERLFAVVMILMSWRTSLSRLLRAGSVWKKGLLSLDKIAESVPAIKTDPDHTVFFPKNTHILRVHQLSLSLGGRRVLSDLNFVLKTGETLGIQLPGGGGKTTLIKLLAGLYRPDSGQIFIDDHNTDAISRHDMRRQIAFVSDAFPLSGAALHDALSNSIRAANMQRAAQEFEKFCIRFPVLAGIELRTPMPRLLPTLSNTQQRLLQVLRARLSDKPFLMLDDLYAGLDATTTCALSEWIQEHFADKGVLLLSSNPEPVQKKMLHFSNN